MIITEDSDLNRVKDLMRKYVGNLVDSEEFNNELFSVNKYNYFLYYCVQMTNDYPNLNDFLEVYLKTFDYNIDQSNPLFHGKFPLMVASMHSRIHSTERTVELLIEAGANVNLQDATERTSIFNACVYLNTGSSIRTIELLIAAGADVNLCGITDWPPLYACFIALCGKSRESACELLINAGANVNYKNSYTGSLLISAIYSFNQDRNIAKIFLLAAEDIFTLKCEGGNLVIDDLGQEFLDYFKIDKETQTIGIKTGKLTKRAIK